MKEHTIEEYRNTYKDYESICNEFSKHSGLSDSEYWVLLMVRENFHTQTAISDELFMSKQTINSASRQLVKKGLIRMENTENNLRTKQIVLTEKGVCFAEKYIDPLSKAEERAWYSLTEEERRTFIGLLKKNNELMKNELHKCHIDKPTDG